MDCRLYFRPWEKVYENEWLEEGGPSLAAVVVNGAAGMNCCHEIRKRSRELPVLWVSDQEGFLAESRRIPVQEFWTQPVSCRLLKRNIEKAGLPGDDRTACLFSFYSISRYSRNFTALSTCSELTTIPNSASLVTAYACVLTTPGASASWMPMGISPCSSSGTS